ncbi:MAG: restriction endonuclease subunit S [Pyrinomonadaceae bacterium]
MENWTKTKIEEIAEVNPSLTKKLSPNDVVTFLGMTDVSEDGKILRRQTKKLAAVKNGFTAFQDGDILVAKITPCFENGKGAFVNELENGVGFGSTEFHVLRANKNVLPEFLYFYTRDFSFRRLGAASMVGSAGQKRVQTNFIETYKISLPPLAEQKKIAEILSTWDKAIETTEKLIAAKQKLKKSLIQRLLTGSQRFSEFHGQEWKSVHIGDVAREVSSKNSKGNQLTVLSCTKHRGLVDSLSYFGKQIFSQNLSTYKIVKRGQFAYATNHIEEGSIGYQNLHDEALISPMYTVFQTNGEIDDSFLYKLLKTETYRHIFEAMTSGSINRRGSLRWNHFAQIKLKLPSLGEQKKIASVLNSCDAEINVLQSKLAALRQQKCGLMQKLLTGETRVKTEEN